MNRVLRRVGILERVGEIGAVDVGDETHARRVRGQRMQRLHGHGRPEVRAADADVDDGGEARAARTAHHAFAHAFGECQHALALGEHLACDVLATGTVGGDAGHAQRRVQYRAPFGGVDGLAAPHGLDARTQAGGIGEARQQMQAVVVDALAGEIEVEAGGFARETAAARRIARRATRASSRHGSRWHAPAGHAMRRSDCHGPSGTRANRIGPAMVSTTGESCDFRWPGSLISGQTCGIVQR